jgi:hypothetical protein
MMTPFNVWLLLIVCSFQERTHQNMFNSVHNYQANPIPHPTSGSGGGGGDEF